MEHKFEATTIEVDNKGYADLQDQLLNNRAEKSEVKQEIPQKAVKTEAESSAKKYLFKKGDQSLELDDDYELEFVADKKPVKLTLRELKDRAAGDVAIKNRMHSLAEEKKRVQSTLKEFTNIAKKDPLAALEFISSKAQESDSEFEYSKYLEKLAEQAENLGRMDEKDRKAWELEKKLAKAEQDLSHKERIQSVVQKKQELLADYPEIGDQQFGQMVDAIMSNEDLVDGIENEMDVMNRVEELIQETLTQRDIISVIQEINPAHARDNELIFSLSDQLRQNPDLDEEDIRDIVRELVGKDEVRTLSRAMSEREKDIRTLSHKARQSAPESALRTKNATPYELLASQLMDKKKEIIKTPISMR